jgi:hypothetical protein
MRHLMRSFAVGASAVAVGGVLFVGSGPALTTASGRTSVHVSARPSARFLASARVALVRYLRNNHPQLDLAGPAPRGASNASEGSFNWAGYADTSTTSATFTKVSGSWTTPAVTCTAEDTISSEWVGIDGATDSTVEQDGTIGWCFEDVPTYFTWYEMYPAGTVEVGTSLSPGDKITAKVTRSGTKYTLAVTDSTNTANSFSVKATCALATCLDESAEWIAERPAFSIGIVPLADYGSWSLSKASETAGGHTGTISSYPTFDSITMLDATQSYNLSTTSSLTGGKAFTTTWLNSY